MSSNIDVLVWDDLTPSAADITTAVSTAINNASTGYIWNSNSSTQYSFTKNHPSPEFLEAQKIVELFGLGKNPSIIDFVAFLNDEEKLDEAKKDFEIESDVVMAHTSSGVYDNFEEMVENLELRVSHGHKIKLTIEEDWTFEIIGRDEENYLFWMFKCDRHKGTTICKRPEEKFQLIEKMRGPNWLSHLENAINSGNTLEHLRRVAKLKSFE